MRELFVSADEKIDIEVELDIDEGEKTFSWLFSLFINFDLEKKSQEEIEVFLEMKESIILILEKNSMVKYVGQRIIDSWVELYFYSLNSKNLQKSIIKYLSESSLQFESGVVRDTKWDFYTANLMPNELEYCFMESQKIINLLEEEGDNIDISREVEHYAMFETSTQKQRFIDSAIENGFKFKDDLSTDECEHGVALTKVHNLQTDTLNIVIKELHDRVKIERGYYELWSTVLVEAE